MIPVALAAVPKDFDFDAEVRQPGLAAIALMVGKESDLKRKGPKIQQLQDSKGLPITREADIPAEAFPPYWRKALPAMLRAYEQRCAYLAMHIHSATGTPTVDHVTPKSFTWNEVYEWANYRLCAAIINSKKGALRTLADPFKIGPGWFALSLITMQVERGVAAPQAEWARIDATLPVLNHPVCVRERTEYVRQYWLGSGAGGFDLGHLEKMAPFIAEELARQGFEQQVCASWFVVAPETLRFEKNPAASKEAIPMIEIMLLSLNDPEELKLRAERVRRLSAEQLERRLPFIAAELRRQKGSL